MIIGIDQGLNLNILTDESEISNSTSRMDYKHSKKAKKLATPTLVLNSLLN